MLIIRHSYFSCLSNVGDSMADHNGKVFSTKDADNHDCAHRYRGAWWYNYCHLANLNGLYLNGNITSYADGIIWWTFRGPQYSLKNVVMKIAPRN